MSAFAHLAKTPLAALDVAQETETVALAARLAQAANPGDVFLLSGELGAGKTAFARGFVQFRLKAEGRYEDVPSPTFTLVQTYITDAGEIWHADLYRLADPSEFWELGLLDHELDAILLVEWPEKAGAVWPRDAHWLRFETIGPDHRRISLCRDGNQNGRAQILRAFESP